MQRTVTTEEKQALLILSTYSQIAGDTTLAQRFFNGLIAHQHKLYPFIPTCPIRQQTYFDMAMKLILKFATQTAQSNSMLGEWFLKGQMIGMSNQDFERLGQILIHSIEQSPENRLNEAKREAWIHLWHRLHSALLMAS